jgi:fluoride exporter
MAGARACPQFPRRCGSCVGEQRTAAEANCGQEGHSRMRLLLLAIGAVLGAFSRYYLGTRLNTAHFPYGTLLINVSGCLVIGFFGVLATERLAISPNLRVAIQIGFLGSYTTFSSFGYETWRMLDDGRLGAALVSFAATNGLGFAAVALGAVAARALALAQAGGMTP